MAIKSFSKQDLELLGYTNIVPVAHDGVGKIFDAEASAGIKKVKHTFAYLPPTCTIQDAKNLAKLLLIKNQTTFL